MNPLTDPSLRRFFLTLSGLVAAAGNKRLGLELTPEEVFAIITLIITYVTSSNWKQVKESAAASGAAAAATVVTPADAAAVLGTPVGSAGVAPEVKP